MPGGNQASRVMSEKGTPFPSLKREGRSKEFCGDKRGGLQTWNAWEVPIPTFPRKGRGSQGRMRSFQEEKRVGSGKNFLFAGGMIKEEGGVSSNRKKGGGA